jgi:hypothetical protein
MIKRIAAQKYGGSGGGEGYVGTAGSTSSMGAGGYSATGYGMGGGQGDAPTVINLTIDGEQIHQAIVKNNDKAAQQGRRSFRDR